MMWKTLETSEVFAYKKVFLGGPTFDPAWNYFAWKKKANKSNQRIPGSSGCRSFVQEYFWSEQSLFLCVWHKNLPFPYNVCFVANINMRHIADCAFGHMDNSSNDPRELPRFVLIMFSNRCTDCVVILSEHRECYIHSTPGNSSLLEASKPFPNLYTNDVATSYNNIAQKK